MPAYPSAFPVPPELMILYFFSISVLASPMIPVLSHTERSAHFMVKDMQNRRKKVSSFSLSFPILFMTMIIRTIFDYGASYNFPSLWRYGKFNDYFAFESETCPNAGD